MSPIVAANAIFHLVGGQRLLLFEQCQHVFLPVPRE
jgi:hypothetical protein